MNLDPEKLIMSALAHYMPDVSGRIYALVQRGWDKEDFLVVRATGGGASRQPHLYKVCYFEIEAFSDSRGGASLLSRRSAEAMIQAARDNFRDEVAYLFDHREINAPWLVHDGLSSKHGDTFMFQSTHRISARPLR